MLQRRTSENGVGYYVSPLLEEWNVPHAFTTRRGGVSSGPFASLNLGNPSGEVRDSMENIEANYKRVLEALGCGRRQRCSVHQVHGAQVQRAEVGCEWDRETQAD